jgi:hypothetical protein
MWNAALLIAAVAMGALVVFVIVGLWQVLGEPIAQGAADEEPGSPPVPGPHA